MASQHPMVGLLDAGYVQKDKKNAFHNYKYASDEGVTRKVREVMQENGLHVKSCEIVQFENREAENKKKEVLQYCLMVVSIVLSDGEKDYGPFQGAGSAMDSGDKAVMKAMTAARKYAISQAALISWGDDPEADEKVDRAMGGGAGKTRAVPKTTAPDSLATYKSLLEVAAREGGTQAFRDVWMNTQQVAKAEVEKCREHIKNTPSEQDWLNTQKLVAAATDEREGVTA